METNSTHSANKISKEEFFKILDSHEAQSNRIDKLIEIGLNIWDSDLIEYGNLMFDRVISAYFTDDGVDWISWWLFDKSRNSDLKVLDENGNELPMQTKEDFWEQIKQYRK